MKTVAPEATGRALCGTSKEDRGPEQGKRPEGHQHSPQTRHPDVDGAEVRKRPSSPTQDWKSARAWILELQLQLILLQMMSLPCSSASGTPDHILSYRLFADYLKTLGGREHSPETDSYTQSTARRQRSKSRKRERKRSLTKCAQQLGRTHRNHEPEPAATHLTDTTNQSQPPHTSGELTPTGTQT